MVFFAVFDNRGLQRYSTIPSRTFTDISYRFVAYLMTVVLIAVPSDHCLEFQLCLRDSSC